MIYLQFERTKLANRIKLYLKVHEMTQIEIAEFTGINIHTLHKLVNGHRVLDDKIAIICYYLDIDIRDYVTEVDTITHTTVTRYERQFRLKGL